MNDRQISSIVLASLSLGLALAVAVVWVARLESIATALPFLMAMKFDAALAFLAASAGFVTFCLGFNRAAAFAASAAVFIAVIVMVQGIVGFDFHVDRILVTDWFTPNAEAPGKMSVIGALSVTIIGLITLIKVLAPLTGGREVAIAVLSLTGLVLAMTTAAGYLTGSAFAIRLGAAQEMSIPGVICTCLLTVAIVIRSWRMRSLARARVPLWLPAAICFGVVIFDALTPLDINAGILYLPLVLSALWFERPATALVFAAVASILIVFGFFVSAAGQISPMVAVFNRSIAIATVWIVALLVADHARAAAQIEQFSQHLESAQQVAALRSFQLDFAKQNRRGDHGFNIQADDPGGRTPQISAFDRKAIPAEDLDRLDHVVAEVRAGRRPPPLDYSFLDPRGGPRVGTLSVQPVSGGLGKVAGLIGVVHDVTDARAAEAREAAIEARLRHSDKLETLGTLAASIAHDLNNTLVPATTLIPLLIEEASEPSRRSLEIILSSARRARELVREIVVFSRNEESAREVVDLAQLAGEALVMVRAGIPAWISIESDLRAVAPVRARKGQIYQVILNLVTNAAQAMSKDGKLIVGTHMVSRQAGGDQVCLYVNDNGHGMDDATQAHIFEPYFTTGSSPGNSGLGLSIVKGIVRAHGGEIVVVSKVGLGTRFNVLFPVAGEPMSVGGADDVPGNTAHR